jgi:hypothetical protein
MKKLLVVVPLMLMALQCSKSAPTSTNNCAYDGYSNIAFTSSGYATRYDVYDRNNTMSLYYTYNYNTNNDVTSVDVHSASGSYLGSIISSLNAAGNSDIDRYVDQDSAMFEYETYTYDSNSKLTASACYSPGGSLRYTYKYFYDNNNRSSGSEKYDSTNTLIEKTTNTRSSSGTLVSATTTDAKGNKKGYRDYSYSTVAYMLTITYYDCLSGAAKRADEPLFHERPERFLEDKPAGWAVGPY